MDTNREEEHLDEGALDESKALAALERMRDDIARYQAQREEVNQQFERFIQSFKKPEPLEAAFTKAPADNPSPEPGVPSPEPQVPSPEPRVSAFAEATADKPSPEPRAAVPLPPVAPDTPFEPLNLQPFARQLEGPRVERQLAMPSVDEPAVHEPAVMESPMIDVPKFDTLETETQESATRQPVPTSPEAFAAREDDEDPDATFAPGEAFDALPPPLQATDDSVALSPPPPEPRPPAQTRTWALIGGIVLVAAAGAYMWMQGETSDPSVVEQPAPAPGGGQTARSQDQRPPETGQATTGSGQRAQATPQPAATLQTEILTTEPAWVRVIADGERVIERELPADARIPFNAERTIQIRTGNAGAVRLSIHGKDLGPLGKIGEVVTRSFTVPQ